MDHEKFKTKCETEEKRCERCKKIFLSKLGIYSILYGLFGINFIDLVIAGPTIAGYHIWLTIAYFVPFLPLLLLFGFEDWELVGALGLTASLMNDVFSCPVGMLFLGVNVNLSEWYAFQLGFKGFEVWWNFNGGFVMVPVSSLLMGLTIYARIGIVGALVYRWWNYKHIYPDMPST
ncbi:MAG: hypothetical protein CW716_01390 [Candidatus Bathyarchaeum sp.]|nr:MAG: hypothetical protein CW716_01390 [Candidatus Bathyarchaeum sp.]